MYSYSGINQALVGLSKELLKKGVWRKTPGFQSENSNRCLEFPFPVTVEIKNPSARVVRIPERKWNSTLPFAESLWLALGWNDLDELPGKYVKNLYNFSDDGRTWRAGYGPRIRFYNDSREQYDIPNKFNPSGSVDQLRYVVELLKKDPYTRQALITIHDPLKDSNIDLETKDQPCTRSIHFMLSPKNELNCYVTMRSNDLLWGFSAVNVFNFTFMQEYVARLLGVKIGKYYHIAHNFHIYEKFLPRIKEFAKYDLKEVSKLDNDFINCSAPFEFVRNIKEFNLALVEVLAFQERAFKKDMSGLEELKEINEFQRRDGFFIQWALAFYMHSMEKETREYVTKYNMNLQYL